MSNQNNQATKPNFGDKHQRTGDEGGKGPQEHKRDDRKTPEQLAAEPNRKGGSSRSGMTQDEITAEDAQANAAREGEE